VSLILKKRYEETQDNKFLYNAIQNADKAIEYSQENPEFWKLRANLYIEDGKPQQAIDDYDKIIKLAPENLYYLMERGLLYFDIKNYEKAFIDLRDARSQGLEDPRVAEYIAKIKRLKTWNKDSPK
jgi:tetratricopeptide (TPR) repeat protein